jgi:Putative metal-binding domain of cation transport ATPase.
MQSIKKECTLCDLAVEISGFKLETKEGLQHFCCEGCLSVYRLLNPHKLLPPLNEKKK